MAANLLPEKADRAASRDERSGEQVECGALTRAVRPDQPKDLTLLQLEGNLVDGGEAAEDLRESLDRQHRGISFLPRSRGRVFIGWSNCGSWATAARRRPCAAARATLLPSCH